MNIVATVLSSCSHNRKNLHKFRDVSQFRSGDVSITKKLWDRGSHRKIHVQLFLALFQGKLGTTEERHYPVIV